MIRFINKIHSNNYNFGILLKDIVTLYRIFLYEGVDIVSICKKYQMEIEFILRDLEAIERGDIHEIYKTPGVTSAKTYAKNIKKNFIDLVEKIENQKESTGEIVSKAFRTKENK
jgi:hypothetical protein